MACYWVYTETERLHMVSQVNMLPELYVHHKSRYYLIKRWDTPSNKCGMYGLELKQILMAQVRSKRFGFPRFLLLLHCFFFSPSQVWHSIWRWGETDQPGFLIILHNMLTLFKSTAQVLKLHWEVLLKNSSEGKSSHQQYIKQCTWSCLGQWSENSLVNRVANRGS